MNNFFTLSGTSQSEFSKYIDTTEKYSLHFIFIKSLFDEGIISDDNPYFVNYMGHSYTVFLGHVKSAYRNYVESNSWTEEKLKEIIKYCIQENKMLVTQNLMNFAKLYDDGKLETKIELTMAERLELAKANWSV